MYYFYIYNLTDCKKLYKRRSFVKVITLNGETGSKKTELIGEIKKELCSQGAKEHFYKEEGADNNDFKALVTFNNKKIAFCSIGYIADKGHLESEYILRGLVFASKNNADILINAYTEPFKEFPESVYKRIVGNYIKIPISKTSDLTSI